MAKEHALVHALDAGHSTFEDFVTERLKKLQAELLRECNRIAVARELVLRRDLDKANKQIHELHERLHDRKHNLSRIDTQLGVISPDQVDVANHVQGLVDPTKAPLSPVQVDDNPLLLTSEQPESGTLKICSSPSKANIVSLDLPLEGELVTQTFVAGAQDKLHYGLWTEWVIPDKKSLRHAPSIDNLEVLLAQEESQMEIDWLHGHDGVKVSHAEGRNYNRHYTCTVAPNSFGSMCWDMISIPVLFYDLITIPLGVFSDMAGKVSAILNWVITIYWTMDMFLRFTVFGYVTGLGEVQFHRTKIAKHYLCHSFFFDFVMVAPDWMSQIIGTPRNFTLLRTFRLVRLSRILRMSKLKQITRKLQDAIDSEYFSIVSNIIGNLLAIVGWCHYLGCFWFWLGSQETQGYLSWVEVADFEYARWPYKYLLSMHWAITQFTPASSKIGPENPPEAAFSITVLIFGMLFFSLFISGLTQDRIHLKALSSKIDNENWTLRKYLRQRGVSADLTVRAIKYVDSSVAPMMQKVQRKDVMLLEYLSRPLQLEVQAELFCKTLLIHPFLRKLREHSGVLTSSLFTRAVHNISLALDDLLFAVGQVCHEMFFMEHGSLIYLKHGTNVTVNISAGHYLCEMVIWVPWVHMGTVKAASEIQIVSIDSAAMRTIVLEHKERAFVRKCAEAYLKDLNDYVESGLPLTDMVDIIALENSQYMQCVQSE